MRFYAAEYSHENDRMEKTSTLFDTYREAKEWLEANGRRNADNDLVGMIGNDHHITFPEAFKSTSSDGRLMSSTKKTPSGWRARLISKAGRKQTRMFRARGVNNLRAAQQWIHEQIKNYDDFKANRGEFAADDNWPLVPMIH